MAVFAPRYARAFAAVAKSNGLDVAAAQQQLRDFAGTFAGSRELREFLMNPAIAGEQKLKVLTAVAARIEMFPQVRNFIAVIMHHDRLGELEQILTEYDAVADEQAHVVDVAITSAHVLETDERQALEEQAERLAGGAIRTTYYEDAGLLGGAVIRIGSMVYDGSIRAQLEQLKHRLINA